MFECLLAGVRPNQVLVEGGECRLQRYQVLVTVIDEKDVGLLGHCYYSRSSLGSPTSSSTLPVVSMVSLSAGAWSPAEPPVSSVARLCLLSDVSAASAPGRFADESSDAPDRVFSGSSVV